MCPRVRAYKKTQDWHAHCALGYEFLSRCTRHLKNNRAVLDRLVLPPDEGEPNAAECFVHKYLVHVLVVLLHARFSVVGPIPFLLAAIFFSGHPYIQHVGSTTVLPDNNTIQIIVSEN